MEKLYGSLFRFSILFAVISCALFLNAGVSHAQGQTCLIAVTKVAEGGEGQIFDFQVQVGDAIGLAQFIGGETHVGNFGGGEPVTLTELPNPGWVLADKSCETGPGVTVTEVEGGFTFDCLSPSDIVQGECTFVNVRAVAPIPTLSEWGMIAAAAGLGLVGVFFAVRRRRVFNI